MSSFSQSIVLAKSFRLASSAKRCGGASASFAFMILLKLGTCSGIRKPYILEQEPPACACSAGVIVENKA